MSRDGFDGLTGTALGGGAAAGTVSTVRTTTGAGLGTDCVAVADTEAVSLA